MRLHCNRSRQSPCHPDVTSQPRGWPGDIRARPSPHHTESRGREGSEALRADRRSPCPLVRAQGFSGQVHLCHRVPLMPGWLPIFSLVTVAVLRGHHMSPRPLRAPEPCLEPRCHRQDRLEPVSAARVAAESCRHPVSPRAGLRLPSQTQVLLPLVTHGYSHPLPLWAPPRNPLPGSVTIILCRPV